ncbi:MAG: DEAD/DEAH box helicase [Planctomycetes bacterium]|nr:DEAD/DEAH box helicase [Planctomycetota bacterium]
MPKDANAPEDPTPNATAPASAGGLDAATPVGVPPPRVTLNTILNQFRDDARNNRDLGDRFERLILRYLELDPLHAERFSRVWMWNDWPDKGNVGDVGIDLVAQERATGEYCAIQCKFYLPENTVGKDGIDSFLAAASREPFTSRMLVSTTDLWGKNAEDAFRQSKNAIRITIHDLEQSPIDWSKFDARRPQALALRAKKQVRPHQKAALDDVIKGLAKADRGKLIMACGTGKTFTALRIAEKMAPNGHVLFLVPSLSLMSQSLREWTAEATKPIHSLAVCSDVNIGKKRAKGDDDGADITTQDLAFPATTSAKHLVAQYEAMHRRAKKDKSAAQMTVVFSTYQSIDAVSKAQKAGLPDFDLIICDEAHRTTGVTLSGEDESHFVKVHDSKFIKGDKRLYMTATPRIYGEEAKGKAKDAEAELCSMDDPKHFGEELHRLGFGEAVGKSLLSDYKVLVLAVDEKYVSKTFQRQIADSNNELNLEDAVKITGCWNGLEKRFESAIEAAADLQGDVSPMRRAVAFSRSIKDSKAFVEKFAQIIAAYRETHQDTDNLLHVETDHVDGTFDALKRGALLDWLKADSPENTCRILSNARCLSEGVDVPALDAVIFLNPRNSVIDVVQSVGRVMRKAEGKQYGYIILPIGIPADTKPEDALKDNEKYRVVWQVLQALRAHDDRFNATINQIELNKARPDNIQVIGVSARVPGEGTKSDGDSRPTVREVQGTLAFPQLDEWKDAIYGKIVLKCGDRRYWESWAKDVAVIAERHITRITALLESTDKKQANAFDEFLSGLRHNLNPAVTAEDAIEMLSQHLITRPVFDALFEGYTFTQNNPVSLAMQKMLDSLKDEAMDKETASLEKFYASVRDRAKGIDNAEGRQRVVVELYDKFFRTAFPRMAERLGIVYTPVEVVDFIVRSVEDVLREEFNSGLGHENVHIIDPFTGTGTFIVRLLQSGLISPTDLLRKYQHELHANEIVLLAYYIAAINIEETFHGLRKADGHNEYIPFEGIVLTDTFQLFESGAAMTGEGLPENTARVRRQRTAPIRVVMSNPPYSALQDSENDNNKNLKYAALDDRIRSTYAARTQATLKNSLYDSYVRAIRWATDRVEGRGVVAFVTNGYFIDGNAMDGLRACLVDEFTSLYVFNLRGNARTSGEVRRAEAGNVFGGGARTPVAITVMVKNPVKTGPAVLRYHDIGDYLSREEKLAIVADAASIGGLAKAGKWQILSPNAEHDWINVRDPAFERFIPLGDKYDSTDAVFCVHSGGVKSNRDAWVYNFAAKAVRTQMRSMIEVYNTHLVRHRDAISNAEANERAAVVDELIDTDPKKIAWTREVKADLARLKPATFRPDAVRVAQYRPFAKQYLYFSRQFNNCVYQIPRVFPKGETPNMAICVSGGGTRAEFTMLMTGATPDLSFADKSSGSQCFPLYLYEPVESKAKEGMLIDTSVEGEVVDGYRRRDAITDAALKTFRTAYGPKVTKEDIFYYVYGVLHSPEYRTRFASNLKKELPRIPQTKNEADFRAFSKAGRDLAHWHLNYETIDPYPVEEHSDALALDPNKHYLVQKMTFARPSPEQKAKGEKWDKTRIVYNSHITLSGIPLEAYEYVVNGKPAIEWVMERYQVTRDKDSGIPNDPNDWAREHKQPRYILDLVKRVVRVSIETMKIVKSLPALNERV